MDEGRSLEGWVPEIGGDISLPEVVDLAFDYRGDVTVERADGVAITGYVFNRGQESGRPVLQMFATTADAPLTIPYAEIRTIRFTGKDSAAGKSYAAWLERKAAAGNGERG